MTTEPSSTQTVHIQRVLSVPPERVWQAITSPAELSKWLAPTEVIAGKGGKVSVFFDDDENVRDGEILIWDEPRTLEYQWIFVGELPSVLRFDLAPHPQGTLLTLQHRLLPTRLSGGYEYGWQAYLDRLEGHFGQVIPDFWERYQHWQGQANC